jgi:membrane fusion protein (multidrug efflux system)
LPPENAVGNYVKVIQRVPVRIFFDEPLPADKVLGPGMSVSPSVRVKEYQLPMMLVLLLALIVAALFGGIWFLLSRRKRNEARTHAPPAEGPA